MEDLLHRTTLLRTLGNQLGPQVVRLLCCTFERWMDSQNITTMRNQFWQALVHFSSQMCVDSSLLPSSDDGGGIPFGALNSKFGAENRSRFIRVGLAPLDAELCPGANDATCHDSQRDQISLKSNFAHAEVRSLHSSQGAAQPAPNNQPHRKCRRQGHPFSFFGDRLLELPGSRVGLTAGRNGQTAHGTRTLLGASGLTTSNKN